MAVEEPCEADHWRLASLPFARRLALSQRLSCDVAVIGAGYTGLTAALVLAEAGRSVMVLDAYDPGFAASGRNAGQILPLMWGARRTPQQISAAAGAAMGERLNRMVAQSGRVLFEWIERHGIACEAQAGLLGVVRSEKSWARQQALMQQWSAFGGRHVAIDRQDLGRYVNSSRYAGGIYFPDGGHVNPLSLTRGLADAVERCGGRIFGSSRVESVQRVAGRWRVATRLGAVDCDKVLVGAGAYADALFPSLRGVGYPVTCGAVATDPLPDRGKSILPGEVAVADLDDPAVFAPRVDARGCLVVSFLLGPKPADMAGALQIIGPRLRRAFPQWEAPPFTRLWTGRFLVSLDGMPRLLRLDQDIYAACVCNGLGHTLGMSAAREMAKLALGAAESELSLPVSAPAPFPASGMLPALLRGVVAPLANRFGA